MHCGQAHPQRICHLVHSHGVQSKIKVAAGGQVPQAEAQVQAHAEEFEDVTRQRCLAWCASPLLYCLPAVIVLANHAICVSSPALTLSAKLTSVLASKQNEVQLVGAKLKKGKSSGADGAPADIWCSLTSQPPQLLISSILSPFIFILSKASFWMTQACRSRLSSSLLCPSSWQHPTCFSAPSTVREWSSTANAIKLDIEKASMKSRMKPRPDACVVPAPMICSKARSSCLS